MSVDRRVVLTGAVAAGMAGLFLWGQGSDGVGPVVAEPVVSPSPKPPPVACWTRRRWFGLYEARTARTWGQGTVPTTGMIFAKLNSDFRVEQLQALGDRGLTPIVSVEPWLYEHRRKDLANPAFDLSSLLRGDHDAGLARIAAVVEEYGGPVLIRFAHEANGAWYPWALGIGANTAAKYRQVWIRTRAMFPPSTKWVWSVNRVTPGERHDVPAMYPGDAHCDFVGWTGYPHRYTADPHDTWDNTYRVLAAITRVRPLMVTETAAPDGPLKLAWTAAMGTWLKAHPRVQGLIWFDHNKVDTATDDYGLNSPAAQSALVAALKSAGF